MITEEKPEILSQLTSRYEESPLYVQVEDRIQEMLRQDKFQVGDPIPGRNILAREFGVSDLTVRKAIGHLIRRGVLVSRQGRGTFVASSPKLQKISLVLGVDAFDSDVSSFFTHFMGVCNREALRYGLVLEPIFLSDRYPGDSLLYCNSDNSRGYEGYIFLGCKLTHPLLSYVKENRLNHVLVTHEQSGAKRVTVNFNAGVVKAIKHLSSVSDENITIVCNSDIIESVRYSVEDFACKIKVIELQTLSRATDCEIGGYRLVKELLSKGESLSTMFFLDNIVARGASRAVLESGIHLDKQINWVLFSGLTEVIPLGFPVSYVITDTEKQAREAVRILMGQIDGTCGSSDYYHEMPRLIVDADISKLQKQAFTSDFIEHTI